MDCHYCGEQVDFRGAKHDGGWVYHPGCHDTMLQEEGETEETSEEERARVLEGQREEAAWEDKRKEELEEGDARWARYEEGL